MKIAALVMALGLTVFGLSVTETSVLENETNYEHPRFSLEEKYERIDEKISQELIDEEEAQYIKERVRARHEDYLENGAYREEHHERRSERRNQRGMGRHRQEGHCGSYGNR